MAPRRFPVASIHDLQLTDMALVERGEGFIVHSATLDGSPCLVVDCGTMLDVEPRVGADDPITVYVFSTAAERESFLAAERRCTASQ